MICCSNFSSDYNLKVFCNESRDTGLMKTITWFYILYIGLLFVKRVLHHRVDMWHTSWSIEYFEMQRNNMQTWMTSCTQKRRWQCRRVGRRCCSSCSSLVFKNLEKKVAAAITTSAIASSAISLLYLHIINMPVHVIWRTTTSSVVAQLCRQVDVRRRTVCERALSQLSGLAWRHPTSQTTRARLFCSLFIVDCVTL